MPLPSREALHTGILLCTFAPLCALCRLPRGPLRLRPPYFFYSKVYFFCSEVSLSLPLTGCAG